MAEIFLTPLDEIASLRERLDGEGKKLILTNGVFDILHVGHARYLKEAAALGDCLVVAINGDDSVRELKGPGRPLNSAAERAEMLLALESVDRVVVFNARRATSVIEKIRPHIYTKGGDYTADSLIDEEKALLDRLGTEIRILALVPGKSTSATLSRLGEKSDRKRIAILGSGTGSNARAILDAARKGDLGGEVVVVMSDTRESGVLGVAREYGVTAILVDPGTEKPSQLTDAAIKEICDRLVALQVDLVVLAGFMRIVREPMLQAFEGRILNIHPSILPAHPGLNPVKKALEAGDTEAGCSIHLVDAGVDTGKVLRKSRVPILKFDTLETLTVRIHEAEHRAYPEVIAEQLKALP